MSDSYKKKCCRERQEVTMSLIKAVMVVKQPGTGNIWKMPMTRLLVGQFPPLPGYLKKNYTGSNRCIKRIQGAVHGYGNLQVAVFCD